MADTIRETPVSPNAGKLRILQGSAERLNYTRSNCVDRQVRDGVVPKTFSSLVPLLVERARTAAALHAEQLGSTVSLSHGDMLGRPLYAVSLHLERTVEMPNQPSWEHLFAFAVLNTNLLFLPGYAIGTWFDTD